MKHVLWLGLIVLVFASASSQASSKTPLLAKKKSQTECSFNGNNLPLEIKITDVRAENQDNTSLETTNQEVFVTTFKQYFFEYLQQCGLTTASTASGAAATLIVDITEIKDDKNPGLIVGEVHTEAVANIRLLKSEDEMLGKTIHVEKNFKRMFVTEKKKNPKWVAELISDLAFAIARDGDLHIAISKIK